MDKQNCLGYVTGIFGEARLAELHRPIYTNPELPPELPNPTPCVIRKFKQLGFSCRKVSDEAEALNENERLIAFWGFFPHKALSFSDEISLDFHFAKKEDGIWSHKWGWDDQPTEITLEELSATYRQNPMFFAIRKEAP